MRVRRNDPILKSVLETKKHYITLKQKEADEGS